LAVLLGQNSIAIVLLKVSKDVRQVEFERDRFKAGLELLAAANCGPPSEMAALAARVLELPKEEP
jgi:hypothetical protein